MSLNSRFALAMLALMVQVAAISVINVVSVLCYLYFLLLTLMLYRLLIGKWSVEPLFLYAFYSFLVIGLYSLQYWTLPKYVGFSGPLGIGTDDLGYYLGAADSIPDELMSSSLSYPYNLAFLPRYDLLSYSRLIRFVTVLPIHHPFDVLFFNALGAVFVPVFTREVAFMLTGQRRVAQTAFGLVAVCPFVLSNSLILVRDGWTATLCIGAAYFLLKRRYLLMIALTALLFYLRVGSGLLSLTVLFSLALLQIVRSRAGAMEKFFFVCGIGVVGILVALSILPVAHDYLVEKKVWGNLLFRVSFLEEFLAKHSPDAELVKIYRQGFLVRILFGVPYFLGAPFFSWNAFRVQGVWVPRGFLMNLFAIAFVVYFGKLIQGILKAWLGRDWDMRVVTVVLLISILIISQVSLQGRHKTMVMPLFYVVVAYGYHNRSSLGTISAIMGTVALVAIEVLVLLMGG